MAYTNSMSVSTFNNQFDFLKIAWKLTIKFFFMHTKFWCVGYYHVLEKVHENSRIFLIYHSGIINWLVMVLKFFGQMCWNEKLPCRRKMKCSIKFAKNSQVNSWLFSVGQINDKHITTFVGQKNPWFLLIRSKTYSCC